jgi:transposase
MRPMAQSVFGMIRIDAIWLALGVSDLRAGMDTLLARVVREMQGGARIHTAYVFANRGATRLKVLVYDGAGLWLCTRRLQQGRFVWPTGDGADAALTITAAQWDWLIAGGPWQHVSARQNITVI